MEVTYNNETLKFTTAKAAREYYELIKRYIEKELYDGRVVLKRNNKVIKAFTGVIPCEQ